VVDYILLSGDCLYSPCYCFIKGKTVEILIDRRIISEDSLPETIHGQGVRWRTLLLEASMPHPSKALNVYLVTLCLLRNDSVRAFKTSNASPTLGQFANRLRPVLYLQPDSATNLSIGMVLINI